ncbi:hypothetical protein MTR67_019443 [Solanum verrucosum]|uniref:Uncharacterized protein n=1 Tax=Solanum verrucosum TaxID=315347 RepID=A0AAF0QPK5_SOLVR|nr:hypothetical protein MTR67_019443 [Solanum verrucosum]
MGISHSYKLGIE